MPSEQTLALIKPHAVFNGKQDEIIRRYESKGFTFVQDPIYLWLTIEQAATFYKEHVKQWFFKDLLLAMTCHMCVALILEGENAVARVRELNGFRDPELAEKETIRREFRTSGGPFNTVHGSANPADAEREIALVRAWKPKW